MSITPSDPSEREMKREIETTEKLDLDGNKVLYEGSCDDNLIVELFGEELDDFTANDSLENYRREYSGESSTWIGRHQPTDEGTEDPENMVDWRVCYDIEKV